MGVAKHYWCDPDDYHASLQIEPQLIVFTIYVHSSRKMNVCAMNMWQNKRFLVLVLELFHEFHFIKKIQHKNHNCLFVQN